MYHSIVLEGILDLINMAQTYPGVIPGKTLNIWKSYSSKMREWLSSMCHPDGQIAFFNDTALNIAPNNEEIDSYAKKLGLGAMEKETIALKHLKSTGYVRVERKNLFLLADVGEIGPDYIPGHAHADTLSFECSIEKQRVIVNSGISCYGKGREREKQRSTVSHNTLAIDGFDSSEVWDGFRVARRARIAYCQVESGNMEDQIIAAHNGFCRLKNAGLHHRTWKVTENRIRIIDKVDGRGSREVSLFYHFHPDVILEFSDTNSVSLKVKDVQLGFFQIFGNANISIGESYYYPEFGKKIPNQKIVIKADTVLPFVLTSQFTFNKAA
jgi:uncharacterized heparinase superfamily protein